ncbi:hypothetical protein PVAP13_9NG185792 [Panicum virgatum]|uniref:Uncharacterized protein n=1 Tax=Panicum virgatum TaxID=38727 RepID=A0A8T0MJ73_PANVG|nr:hypothetical protein PVAP13_9NG185792 [Panicum virgatum]
MRVAFQFPMSGKHKPCPHTPSFSPISGLRSRHPTPTARRSLLLARPPPPTHLRRLHSTKPITSTRDTTGVIAAASPLPGPDQVSGPLAAGPASSLRAPRPWAALLVHRRHSWRARASRLASCWIRSGSLPALRCPLQRRGACRARCCGGGRLGLRRLGPRAGGVRVAACEHCGCVLCAAF